MIGELLARHGREHPGHTALRWGDHAFTYGELDRWANRAGRALARSGLDPGGRFAFIDKNRPEYVPVAFGGARVGGVNLTVNWRLAPAEMAHVLRDAEARVLAVGAELFEKIERVVDELPSTCRVVALDPHPTWPLLDDLARAESDAPIRHAVAPEDPAFHLYTSGTTGLPKGVVVTYDALATQIGGVSSEFGLTSSSVNLVTLPVFHIAGGIWLLAGMFFGSTNVLVREFEPGAVLRAIEAHGVTHALLVPAMLQMLLDCERIEAVDASSLDTVVYGGSPITEAVLGRAVARFGCRFFQNYGLTEASGAVSMLGPEDHDLARPHLLRSAGRPVPWAEVEIIDAASGVAVPRGAVGEICVRSRANMRGYWGRPEGEPGVFWGEWLRTGDAGYFDAEGYLYLHDRVKDMIVTGGENVYPAEVEQVLARHPSVADVAVIGVPSERWGEAVHAVVVPRSGCDLAPDALVAFARDHLAGFKLPKSVEFVDALPRNPSGKVLKAELRAALWGDRDRRVN
jgi:long-chain acyl-CoA synthetase